MTTVHPNAHLQRTEDFHCLALAGAMPARQDPSAGRLPRHFGPKCFHATTSTSYMRTADCRDRPPQKRGYRSALRRAVARQALYIYTAARAGWQVSPAARAGAGAGGRLGRRCCCRRRRRGRRRVQSFSSFRCTPRAAPPLGGGGGGWRHLPKFPAAFHALGQPYDTRCRARARHGGIQNSRQVGLRRAARARD